MRKEDGEKGHEKEVEQQQKMCLKQTSENNENI